MTYGLIIYYAFLHALTPGHSKTLMVAAAISGLKRSSIVKFSLGFGAAHGLTMLGAVGLGFVFKQKLESFMEANSIFVVNLSLYILGGACLYFLWQWWRIAQGQKVEQAEQANRSLMTRAPLLAGAALGLVPCPDSLGMGLVVPNLIGQGHGVALPLALVWLSVTAALVFFGLLLSLFPVQLARRRLHMPEWVPAMCSAMICLLVIAWRVRG